MARPRSIALVGASGRPNPLSFTYRLLESNEALGYGGNIYLVNPNKKPIGGREVWGSLSELPEAPDVVALNLPFEKVLQGVRDAIAAGARALVIHAGGFGERGEEGAVRQRELQAICQDAGVMAIGPNCIGYMSPVNRVSVSSLKMVSDPGKVAIISQSGSAATYLQRLSARHGASFVFSTGNEAVTTAEDLLGHLIEDEATKVVAMFIEALRRPDELFGLAARAHALGKPIIVLKAGLTEHGGEVSKGHTGALAGSGAVYRQAFEQAGIILAEDFDEFGQTLELLMTLNKPAGRARLGICATSGGELGTFTDLALGNGVEMPALQPDTLNSLQQLLNLPSDVFPRNPVDVGTGFNSAETYQNQMRGCIERVASDPNIDVVAMLQSFERASGDLAASHGHQMIAGAIAAAQTTAKPVLLISNLTCVADAEMLADAHKAGVTALNGGREALRALRHVGRLARFDAARTTEPRPPMRLDPAVIAGLSGNVAQASLFALLEQAGIPVTPMRRVTSAAEARDVAASLGGKLVMKIDTDRVVHKSDIGGVALNVEPRTAAIQYETLVSCLSPPVGAFPGEGVVMAPQLDKGVEFYIGAKRDPGFGAVIVCGLGGTLLEIMGKTAIVIAPLTKTEAMDAIMRSGAVPFLSGFRGGPVADLEGLAQLLVAVGSFAQALGPRLEILDLNPIIVNAQFPAGCAADARLFLKDS